MKRRALILGAILLFAACYVGTRKERSSCKLGEWKMENGQWYVCADPNSSFIVVDHVFVPDDDAAREWH